jgi:hypothetical protein
MVGHHFFQNMMEKIDFWLDVLQYLITKAQNMQDQMMVALLKQFTAKYLALSCLEIYYIFGLKARI